MSAYYWNPFRNYRAPAALVVAVLLAACGGNPPPEQVPGSPSAGMTETVNSGDVLTREEIAQINPSRMEDPFDGRIAGVQVASVGGRQVLAIRGRTNPLIVLDRVPLSDSHALWSLNPHDIQEIRVIKDGGASRWGIRGSRGVIEITTRRY
jgi:outer membrane receptor protein involved in Fe transport